MEEQKKTIDLNNLHLYNRYRVDVRLVRDDPENKPDVWRLALPDDEWQWCQYSYDYETEASEDCVSEEVSEEEKRERYCSIDPSGGPYIALGENILSLYPEKRIKIDVMKIFEDVESHHWHLKIKTLTVLKP